MELYIKEIIEKKFLYIQNVPVLRNTVPKDQIEEDLLVTHGDFLREKLKNFSPKNIKIDKTHTQFLN